MRFGGIHSGASASIISLILLLLNACAVQQQANDISPVEASTTAATNTTEVGRAEKSPAREPLFPSGNHDVKTKDAWQRLTDGYQLESSDNPHIDNALTWFQTYRGVIPKASSRARPFLYFIVEEIEARGLPAELALIPLLESGFRVYARSPYGALGLWQFMPATGRQYGLGKSRFFDHRRDFVRSTRAALDYLSDLHKRFDGDWLLAIAAYNAGPGTVSKAKQNQQDSYWDILDRLPNETQAYVPKLLAAARIIASPSAYQTSLTEIPNSPYFETIAVTGPQDFEALANLDNWDQKTFMRLNGALNSGYFGLTKPIEIHVPRGEGSRVERHLASIERPKTGETDSYLVQRGDTLATLALRYEVPVSELRRLNGIDGHYIRAGTTLRIPAAAVSEMTTQDNNKKTAHRHIVKPGDSLWTLGRRYGCSARAIAKRNNLAINKTLYPGQLLHIPLGSLAMGGTSLDYIVERGDSLWSIARRFGIRLDDLKRWNPLVRSTQLRPGQKLLVQNP